MFSCTIIFKSGKIYIMDNLAKPDLEELLALINAGNRFVWNKNYEETPDCFINAADVDLVIVSHDEGEDE